MTDRILNLSAIFGDTCPPDPRLLKLEQRGFEAVPALIEHWDHSRLTRRATNRVGSSNEHLVFVCGPIRTLVFALAGEGLKFAEGRIEKKDVLAWWANARQIGEEDYVVAHLLPASPEEGSHNPTMLRFITAKYSRHLPEIYRTILEARPRVDSSDVLEAIAASSLPRATQLELALLGANDPDPEHRRAGLRALKDIAPQKFVQILIATLESLPNTPAEPCSDCPEATFAKLSMETDEQSAWSPLERVARQSDVGLRVEFMNPMDYTYIADRQRSQRLEFPSHFLDDDEVRDEKSNPSVYQGPFSTFTFSSIEVRNFAA
jgi:hypothetical protein